MCIRDSMDSMLGNGGAMTCGSVTGSPASRDASPSSVSEAPQSAGHILLSASPTHRGFECGCGGSCHATSPTSLSAPVAHLGVHAVAQRQPSEPESVPRVPL